MDTLGQTLIDEIYSLVQQCLYQGYDMACTLGEIEDMIEEYRLEAELRQDD